MKNLIALLLSFVCVTAAGAADDAEEEADRVEVPLQFFEFDSSDPEDEPQHDGQNDDGDEREPDDRVAQLP